MALDLTSFDAALKQHYTDDRVENMVFKRNPFLALVPKMENFGGRNLPVPVIYGNPQGRSKTFSTAQSRGAATSSLIDDFIITRVKDYSVATIDNETLEASKGNENAFMSAATTEIDGAINSLTRSLAIGIYRDSSAYIGQVSATPSNNASTFQLTLALTSDVSNFEVGQVLVVYSAKSGGSQRSSDGSAVTFPVVAVNRDTGVLTLTGTYSGSGTMVANDYIFVNGDRGLGISGLAGWIPDTAPTSTLFFGLDRSVDSRLGGLRLDATGLPIEESLIEADAAVSREGFYIDHIFMNPKKLGDLKKALGTKVNYVTLAATANVSFTGVEVDGDKGQIKVIGDHNCPYDRAYGLAMEYWTLGSIDKAVKPIDSDGLQMLRQSTSDGVEVRYGFYGNLWCRAPGSNIVIKFS